MPRDRPYDMIETVCNETTLQVQLCAHDMCTCMWVG